jgi:SPOR domain
MSKLEAFAKQAEGTYEGEEPAPAVTASETPAVPSEITEASAEDATPAPSETPSESSELVAAADPSEPVTKVIPQTVEKIPPKIEGIREAGDTGTSPTTTVKAGTSPDTIAFVKSVLDEKDGKIAAGIEPGTEPTEAVTETASAATVTAPEKIEPAAGAAAPAVKSVVPGQYYVQLASVGAESGAPKEWTKLQKQFPSTLGSMKYRVQSAAVAGKGTMYRIQAGPLKRDDALNACAAIKIDRPTGCIVVQ